MAEGILRARYGDRYQALSAGTAPGGVNPFAIDAMKDLGIDISEHRSEHVDVYADHQLDYVVTVCDSAKESCPYIPATKRNMHMSFPDPSATEGSDVERLAAFRSVRDAIASWIEATFGPNGGP